MCGENESDQASVRGSSGPLPPVEIGGMVDSYELIRQVGADADGLFVVRDTDFGPAGDLLLLRVVPPEVAWDELRIKTLRRDLDAASALVHSRIAKVLPLHTVTRLEDPAASAAALSVGDAYIVQELPSGEPLDKWRTRFPDGRVPFLRALSICRQVGEALDLAHARGVVHGGLFPGAVLVKEGTDRTDVVKVHGFGTRTLEKIDGDSGPTGRLLRAYEAPERVSGEPPGPREDQYALGVLLYDLLVGEVPFAESLRNASASDPDPARPLLVSELKRPKDLSRSQFRTMCRALEPQPHERFRSCDAFIAALDPRGAGVRGVPNRRRRGAGSDRRPVLIVALVAVAVLCWWTVPWLWRLTGWGSAVDPGAPGVGTVAPSHLVPNVLEGEGDDSTGLTVPVDDATDRTRSWATVEEAHEFVPGAGQQPVEDGARDWDDSLLVDIPEVGKPWRVPGLGLEMGPVQSGSFAMGSEDGDPDERPVRRVTLSTPLWMGRFEITNEQYSWFVRRSGYSASTDADSEYLKQLEPGEPGGRPFQPVCFVSWYDAAAFCDWLTQWERSSARLPTGYRFRLPTEAEWEYACRAGSEEPYPTPLEDYACFRDNAPGASLEVGRFRANAWGFHDMNGNVWEWCLDTYSADAYAKLPAQDPWNSAGGALRVVRGGSWTNVARGCRASNRYGVGPHYAFGALGFRIVLARDLSGTAADAEPATEP